MIVSRSFYIDHKLATGFARIDLSENIPTFETLEQWRELKSTKVDTVALACVHLLSSDSAPRIYVENDVAIFPPIPPRLDGKEHTKTNKILIYQEFPSMTPLLRNVRADLTNQALKMIID